MLAIGTVMPETVEAVVKLKRVNTIANQTLNSLQATHNPTLTKWLAQLKKAIAAEVTMSAHYDGSPDYCAYTSDYLGGARKAGKTRLIQLAADLGLDRVGLNAMTTVLTAVSAMDGLGKRLAPVLRATGYSSKQIELLLGG
jgi:hypothetical protein